MFEFPTNVQFLIQSLNQQGHQAYAVGGCVRDSLRGLTPIDWDLCTSAHPDQVMSCFSGCRVLQTGLKHGTVSVLLQGIPYEITTYRTDGDYSDGRHPDHVRFVGSLRLDLSRRDFTINAMAAHPQEGILDYFGGQPDLSQGLIRCVGDPDRRFQEDGLRIMRAVRFASVLGFAVEPKTRLALLHNAPLLEHISAERLQIELSKLLLGSGVAQALLEYGRVLSVFLPELTPALQNNEQWKRIALGVDAAPPSLVQRMAMLLLPLSLPTEGVHGVLTRLRFRKADIRAISELLCAQNPPLPLSLTQVKHLLCQLGPERFYQLLDLKRAELVYQERPQKIIALEQAREMADHIQNQNLCYSLAQLAVNGRDLVCAGLTPGQEVGQALHLLLHQVIEGQLPNERETLLAYILREWL